MVSTLKLKAFVDWAENTKLFSYVGGEIIEAKELPMRAKEFEECLCFLNEFYNEFSYSFKIYAPTYERVIVKNKWQNRTDCEVLCMLNSLITTLSEWEIAGIDVERAKEILNYVFGSAQCYNYITLKEGKIISFLESTEVTPQEFKFRTKRLKNGYEAIITKDGKLYFASDGHNILLLLLMDVGVNTSGAIRVTEDENGNTTLSSLNSNLAQIDRFSGYYKAQKGVSEFNDVTIRITKEQVKTLLRYVSALNKMGKQQTLAGILTRSGNFGSWNITDFFIREMLNNVLLKDNFNTICTTVCEYMQEEGLQSSKMLTELENLLPELMQDNRVKMVSGQDGIAWE